MSAALFAVVGSFTPGPNNAMLLASGVNFGLSRTMPHIIGVTFGYAVMFAAVALGLGRVFTAFPALYSGLKIFSTIYILWLAWRIATATDVGHEDGRRAPLTVFEAALFQWINPKGVALALAAAANFLKPETLGTDLPVMLALIIAVSSASTLTWTMFGQAMRGFLADNRRRQVFNWVMAIALVASLWPILAGGLAGGLAGPQPTAPAG